MLAIDALKKQSGAMSLSCKRRSSVFDEFSFFFWGGRWSKGQSTGHLGVGHDAGELSVMLGCDVLELDLADLPGLSLPLGSVRAPRPVALDRPRR